MVPVQREGESIMSTVILLNNDQMGVGDRDLGQKVLGNCLKKIGSFTDLEAIALYNAGVKLAAKDSPVAVELSLLHERGVDILACVTCVNFYGLADKLIVDKTSSLDDILAVMKRAERVITL